MNTLPGPHEIIFLSGVLRCHALFYIKDKQSDETTWNQRLRASTEGNFSHFSLVTIMKNHHCQHQQIQLCSSIKYLCCGCSFHIRVLISHILKSHTVIAHIFWQVIGCSFHIRVLISHILKSHNVIAHIFWQVINRK